MKGFLFGLPFIICKIIYYYIIQCIYWYTLAKEVCVLIQSPWNIITLSVLQELIQTPYTSLFDYFFFLGGGLKVELNSTASNDFSLYWEPKMQLMVVWGFSHLNNNKDISRRPNNAHFPLSFPCFLIITDKSIVSAGRVFLVLLSSKSSFNYSVLMRQRIQF